ncbi:MAG: metal ABC transporter permease [Desulfovibrio sp.]|nr:metal ABC transporter permease [Desulfovibrio sp.]
MPDFSPIYVLISCIPLECLQWRFMQQALFALFLLAPMASVLGVEVINFRMAFFSDAIGHSAFAGVALGLLLAVPPRLSMPLFGLLVGIAIVAVRRKSALSADTVIGIVFSAVVAFGLAVVSRAGGAARDMQRFLYGDILTITETELAFLCLLFVFLAVFQLWGYNRLLLVALNPVMARAHGVRVALWQYLFAALLALVVMFSVWAVGVLLVTALLIVPAATARNLARSAGGMFWWSLLVGITSAFVGLVLSAQDWLRTSSGATIILTACCWFAASLVVAGKRRQRS